MCDSSFISAFFFSSNWHFNPFSQREVYVWVFYMIPYCTLQSLELSFAFAEIAGCAP